MRAANRMRAAFLTAAGVAATWGAAAHAGNATVPGAITCYSTIVSAGIEWRIAGDDNANCAVAVAYRRAGTSAWLPAQPLLRVETGLWHHGEDPGNLLAGSLFSLAPATTYDVRLTLADPDGGAATQIVQVTTHAEPRPDPAGRTLHVVPGAGGGSGTAADPFRGLAAADAAARPGDTFVLAPGTYAGPFAPRHDGTAASPIAWLGADAATTIVDGQGGTSATSHCVELTHRRYVLVGSLTLANALVPVAATGTVGAAIQGCTIVPVPQLVGPVGIQADSVQDVCVADNTLLMPGQWATIGRTGAYGTGGYGLELTGNGIVVCYNHVVEAWDGFDVGGGDGTGLRTYNADVYGNFVDRAADDACQTDAVHQNVRVFGNRFLNCGSAVSCQPCFGGPCYFLFNEMANVRIDPFKYHQETFYFGAADPQETSGMIAYHNTVLGSKSGWYESGLWHHVIHRDNLLLGARANTYSLYVAGGQRGDLDYDGYNRQQATLVKWNGAGYATLPAFAAGAGQEAHGVEVGLDAFVRAAWPAHPEWDWTQGYGAPLAPGDEDLELAAGSVAVDRGVPLANVDDGFTGAAPDLGCHERGVPMPAYGPRPAATLAAPAPPPGASGLRLRPPSPNPSAGAVGFVIEPGADAAVSVRVLDVAGRAVRTLAAARPLPPGAHAMVWDGLDDAGAPAPDGLYYLVVRAGGAVAHARLVRVN